MARMPIEVADLRTKRDSDLTKCMEIANALQQEFVFLELQPELTSEMQLFAFNKVATKEFLDLMEQHRARWRGFHPFLLSFVSGSLASERWSNLFSSRRAAAGVSVSTTCGVEGTIIPTGRMASYLLFSLARTAFAFAVPDHKYHDDTRGCVNDFRANKMDLILSMKARALCDDCRRVLLVNGNGMSPPQFEALDALFAESGRLLDVGVAAAAGTKPKVFIASSTEGLEVARCIQLELARDCSVEIWNQGTVFGLGSATIEALESAVTHYDFGIFVFTPDDELVSRGQSKSVARDNVVFEAGLFIGSLTRFRAFVVRPPSVSLPTDFDGVATATYDSEQPNRSAAVGPACHQIRIAMKRATTQRDAQAV